MVMREGKEGGGKGPLVQTERASTLAAGGAQQVVLPADPVVFQSRIARNDCGQPEAIVPALASEATGDSRPLLCVDMGGGKGGANVSEEQAPTLNTSAAGHAVLPAEQTPASPLVPALHTLEPSRGDGRDDRAIGCDGTSVRRLTPLECERLQGFPDNYTLIPGQGINRAPADLAETVAYLVGHGLTQERATQLAQSADGPRYKALGNSMAVPVMAWIGARVDLVDRGVPWSDPGEVAP